MVGVQQERKSNIGNTGRGTAGCWSAEHVAQIGRQPLPEAALIHARDALPIDPALVLWDLWPVQTDDGALAQVCGGTLWVILSAPRCGNPDARHDVARMRLFHRIENAWRDCGALLPDDLCPGNREWSGSTRLDPKSGTVTLWFTAAGRREGGPQFEQRLFVSTGQLDATGELPKITGWSVVSETLHNDGALYADTAVAESVPGRIKGFRDPFWFRDPQTQLGYLLFTASQPTAASTSDYDGVIGIAKADDADGQSTFTALPALIDAMGVSNELELPHIVYRDGRYYLFWCTQEGVFAPGGPTGPTGLYGMVASTLFGPYEPLNGTGLVLANPAAEPRQAYGWRVLPSLEVVSFVDYWGVEGRDIDRDPALKASQFGGTVAPVSRIEIIGNVARIVATQA
jgi:levansucrase